MQDDELKTVLTKINHIAIVGASDDPHRASYEVMVYLLGQGYEVTPVNPKLAGQQLLGREVYANLEDIPYSIDMVDVFRQSAAAYQVAEEAISIKASVLWLQIGVINEEAARLAREAGLTVIMNRCPKKEISRLGLQH